MLRTPRRLVVATAALIGASLALSGCVLQLPMPQQPGGASPDAVYPHGPLGETVDANLQEFYSQDVNWTECGTGNICGTISSPMDWFNPADHDPIEIAVAIRPATGERQGAILYNPGGPGASGRDYVMQYAEYLLPADVLKNYDLVGFDPRGVGASTRVDCYDDPSELYNWIYVTDEADIPDPSIDPLSDERLDQTRADAREFGAACLENTGEFLGFVGTEQAASDMDLIRSMVGEEKLNYLGVSYGTLLGATYADLFPKNVGRFVLDAAIAPDSTDGEGTLFQAGGFELAYRNFLADCLGQNDCPFDGSVDQALAATSEMLNGLNENPIKSPDGRYLVSGTMFTAIAANLYADFQWEKLRGIIADVRGGKVESAFAAADGYYSVNPDGTFADNSLEALIAVNCLDYPAITDYDQVRANAREIMEVAPTLGPDFIGLGTCSGWPMENTRTPHEVTAPGADPIIVIGGINDPATPYEWSVRLAGQLESGVLITVDAEGHSQYNSGNRCVDEPVSNYFLTGNAPANDIPNC